MRLPVLFQLAVLQLVLAPVWSAVVYWENHVESSSYEIQSGDTVVLRGYNKVLGQLRVAAGGTLTIDDARDTFLQLGNLDVSGLFIIGSASSPYSRNASFELLCLGQTTFSTTDERRKGVVVRENGAIALFGAKGARQSWIKLSDTAEAGSTCLNFELPGEWSVGDEIVIPSTDFDPHQTEKRTIVGSRAGYVEVDSPLEYSHFGRVVNGVDERAEIGLLTRNIVFRGCRELSGDLADVGGHIMFLSNFQRVQLQDVELQNFGQGDRVGRYPLHFHMGAQVPSDTFLRHNSIHSSNFRAVVVHGTQGVAVAGNVAYNITGHAVFLEDGSETSNIIQDNLVVLVKTKDSGARIGSNSSEGLSGFWLTNADNIVTGNVAVAVEGAGFWLHTRLGVKGESSTSGKYANVQPYRSPMTEMRNNSAHSSAVGFRIESPQFDSQDSPQQVYSPPYTYIPDELPVIEHFRVHHCRQGGWFRLFELQLNNWVVADVTEGVQMLTQGNTATNDVATYITNSLFVGGTSNRGNLVASDWQFVNYLERRSDSAIIRTSDMRTGVKLYDGPVYLTNCTFTHWYSQSCLNYINPAVGAREYNTFVMPTNSFARDLVFIETEYPMFIIDRLGDGGKTTSLLDASGSISGRSGANVLPDWDFYATSKCDRQTRFGLACPHKYANFDVVAVGSSDDPSKHGLLTVYRNNVESDAAETLSGLDFSGQYIPASNGWLYHPILSPGAVYTLRFENDVPSHLSIVMSDTEHGQIFTLLICYPAETTIKTVRSRGGDKFVQMASTADAECTDCYLYDSQHHVLLLRLRESGARVGLASACPVAGCSEVDIVTEIPISDGVEDAFDYVVRELQVYDTTPASWTEQQFVQEESAASSLSLDLDWCSLNDPCLNAIDEGNRKIGILAYLDSPCSGIGCFSTTCRYCKLSASTAAAPFLPCPYESSLASDLAQTTTAPEECSSYVTAAEIALHVDVVVDTSCAASGVGCISDNCRYCKSPSSPEYVPYFDCSEFGVASSTSASQTPTPTTSTTTPPSTPSPTLSSILTQTPTPTSANPSPAPATTPAASITIVPTPTPTATSPATTPASTFPGAQLQSNPCSTVVPNGDTAVGISAMVDTSCAVGGIGCFSAQCRFCNVWNSTQSQNFVQCPPPSTPSPSPTTPAPTTGTPPIVDACWSAVSPGDIAAGVAAVSDAACKDGGLGCFSRTCRFCKAFETAKSSAYASCSTVNATATAASTSTLQPTATPTPTPTPTRSQDVFCSSLVTSGDSALGISALGDANCGSGGLGCLSASCRFCRTRPTPQSRHLYTCGELVSTRKLAGFESVAAPIDSSEPCLALASKESAAQGVYGFTDASCAVESDSDQCFTSTCRACKFAGSSSATDAPACPKYISKAMEMEAQESAEAVSSSWDCTFALSIDVLARGIAGYADKSCPPTPRCRPGERVLCPAGLSLLRVRGDRRVPIVPCGRARGERLDLRGRRDPDGCGGVARAQRHRLQPVAHGVVGQAVGRGNRDHQQPAGLHQGPDGVRHLHRRHAHRRGRRRRGASGGARAAPTERAGHRCSCANRRRAEHHGHHRRPVLPILIVKVEVENKVEADS